MNNKVRFQENKIEGYSFKNYPNLYFHSGQFWFEEKICKRVENNGSLSIKVNKSKLGLKKLRKNAIKFIIELQTCPF